MAINVAGYIHKRRSHSRRLIKTSRISHKEDKAGRAREPCILIRYKSFELCSVFGFSSRSAFVLRGFDWEILDFKSRGFLKFKLGCRRIRNIYSLVQNDEQQKNSKIEMSPHLIDNCNLLLEWKLRFNVEIGWELCTKCLRMSFPRAASKAISLHDKMPSIKT